MSRRAPSSTRVLVFLSTFVLTAAVALPLRAQIQPYRADTIRAHHADTIRTHTGQTIQPHHADTISSYRAHTIEPYHAQPIEPYHAQPIEPYHADTIRAHRGQEIRPYGADSTRTYKGVPMHSYGGVPMHSYGEVAAPTYGAGEAPAPVKGGATPPAGKVAPVSNASPSATAQPEPALPPLRGRTIAMRAYHMEGQQLYRLELHEDGTFLREYVGRSAMGSVSHSERGDYAINGGVITLRVRTGAAAASGGVPDNGYAGGGTSRGVSVERHRFAARSNGFVLDGIAYQRQSW